MAGKERRDILRCRDERLVGWAPRRGRRPADQEHPAYSVSARLGLQEAARMRNVPVLDVELDRDPARARGSLTCETWGMVRDDP